jgi:non-ribosomal peptide synthetase component F
MSARFAAALAGSADAQAALPAPMRALWMHQHLLGDMAAYAVTEVMTYQGPLDPAALAGALCQLVSDHPALRTGIDPTGQAVLTHDVEVSRVVSVLVPDADESPSQAARRLHAWLEGRVFDLERPPLLHVAVVPFGPQSGLLGFVGHHLTFDGAALESFWRWLGRYYAVASKTSSDRLPEQRLRGLIFADPTGSDPLRRPARRYATCFHPLPEAALSGLTEAADRMGTGVYVVWSALVALAIAAMGDARSVDLGMPFSLRPHDDEASEFGNYASVYWAVVTLHGEMPLSVLCELIDERLLELIDSPPDTAMQDITAPGRLAADRDPPCPRVVSQLEEANEAVCLGEVTLRQAPGIETELTAQAFELQVCLETSQTHPARIRVVQDSLRHGHAWARTLAKLLCDLAVRLRASGVDTPIEDLLVCPDSVVPVRQGGPHARLTSRVRAVAAAHPGLRAVSDGDVALTYRQLLDAVAAWKGLLAESGLRPGDYVCVVTSRCVALPALILALWELGAVYVPLDACLPQERRESLRALAAPFMTITLHPGAKDLRDLAGIEVSPDPAAAAGRRDASRGAYLIFTSGSTGRAKPVLVPHAALDAMAASHVQAFDIQPGNVVLQVSSVTFDAYITELASCLACGGELRVLAWEHAGMVAQCMALLCGPGIDFAMMTPTLARMVLAANGRIEAGTLGLCGEMVDANFPLHNFASRRVLNLYGPTECTVITFIADLKSGDTTAGVHPIGPVVPTASAAIVDRHGRPLLGGCVGDLTIAGEMLAWGYLGQARESARAWRPDPRSPEGQRAYRTGDRAMKLVDDTFVCLGRHDGQVKIDGKRTEVGELAAEVQRLLPGSVAIPVVQSSNGRTWLDCVVCGDSSVRDQLDRLAERLALRLPAHMLPQSVAWLAQVPTNPSGKLDLAQCRAALEAVRAVSMVHGQTTTWVGNDPVARAWVGCLPIQPRDPDAHFFRHGGTSLALMRLMARLERDLGARISISSVLRDPRLPVLRQAMEQLVPAPADAPVTDVSAGSLEPTRQQVQYLFMNELAGGSDSYAVPLIYRLRGKVDVVALERACRALLIRHPGLRTVFDPTDDSPLGYRCRLLPLEDAVLDTGREFTTQGAAWRWIEAVAGRPFDLSSGPVARFALACVTGGEHYLLLCVHHVATDGWSSELITADLGRFYRPAAHWSPEDEIQPGDPRAQLKVEAALECKRGSGEAFWKGELAGLEPFTPLGTTTQDPARGEHQVALNDGLPQRLDRAARSQDASIYELLLLATYEAVRELTDCEDFCIGVPTANRSGPQATEVVGCITNTVPVRLRGIPRHPAAAIANVARTLRRAREAEHIPLASITKVTGQPRAGHGGSSLVQVVLTIEGELPLVLEGLHCEELSLTDCSLPKFALDIALDLSARPHIGAVYNRNGPHGDRIPALLEDIAARLSMLVSAPSQRACLD